MKRVIILLVLLGGSLLADEKSVVCKNGVCSLEDRGSASTGSENSSSNVIELTADTFDGVLTEATKPVVIDFTATWCQPCRYSKPFFAELAQEEDWVFAAVDVDKAPSLMARCNVQALPTFVIFKKAIQWGMITGARDKEALRDEFKRIINSELPEAHESDKVQQLVMAIGQRNVAEVKQLIAQGANVNGILVTPMGSFSPLMMAIVSGTEELIDILISSGAHIDKDFNDSVIKQLEVYDEMAEKLQKALDYTKERIKRLPSHLGNKSTENVPNFSEQLLAAYHDPVALKKLIDAGAHVDAVISFGEKKVTGLMIAILLNNTAILDLLIEAGASLSTEILDEQGQKQSVEQRIMGEIQKMHLGITAARKRYSYALNKIAK